MTKEQKEAIEMKENSEEIEKLKKVLEERYLYVPGMRTVYARLMCLEKEDIVRDDLSLRNEIHQHIKEKEEKDKEIETLKRDFKIVDQECSRLEQKETILDKVTDKLKEDIEKYNKELTKNNILSMASTDLAARVLQSQKILNIIEGEKE